MRLKTSLWIAMPKASVRAFIGHVAYILYTGSTYQPVHSCHCHCHSSLWQVQLSLHPYLTAVCVTYITSSVVRSDTVHCTSQHCLVQGQYFTQSWFMIWETFQRICFVFSWGLQFGCMYLTIYLVAFGWLYGSTI